MPGTSARHSWARPWWRRVFGGQPPRHAPGGAVRPCLESLETRELLTAYLVVLNTDTGGPGGTMVSPTSGDLRYCIDQANLNPGPDVIAFQIGAVGSQQTISPAAPLPPITDAVMIDGWSQGGPGYAGPPLIQLDGTGAGSGANGLLITAQDNTVRGLVISSFDGNGIRVSGAAAFNNVIEGNYLGTDANGTAAQGNHGEGVLIDAGAGLNTIGGTTAAARNVISGNGSDGVLISGPASGNMVQGNFIGTDVTGTAALGNAGDGINITSGSLNTVGGTVAGAGNVISGNGTGVFLYGAGASGNAILGSLIGTDVQGTAALGNTGDGIDLRGGASANIIGTAGAGNLISGNGGAGVQILDSGTSGNVVLGNLIGTDRSGTAALANTWGVVIASGATQNTVGGTAAGSRNVLSGNQAQGVSINDTGTSGNVVLGNLIGTDVHGTAALGNGHQGVLIQLKATGNTVGGTAAGSANVISGNYDGMYFKTPGTSGNVVVGNLIGTDAGGTAALGNTRDGIHFASQVSFNTVGGTAAGSANVISGNGRDGLYIQDGSSGNVVLGNLIGTDRSGTASVGNALAGVAISQAQYNTVGGTAAGSANVISGNGGSGVFLYGPRASGNVVLGNLIGTDRSGTAALGNANQGVVLQGGPTVNTIGGTAAGAGNVISANNTGVYLYGSGTSGNVVLGNLIGTDRSGTANLGNTGDGVQFVAGAAANTLGGTTAGAGNTIAFNQTGVSVVGPATQGDSILGNAIYGNAALGIDLGDDGVTPNDPGDTDTGANDLQNFPVLQLVSSSTVSGILDSLPATMFRLEFFANAAADPSGFGQGAVFLGSTTVTSTSGPTPFSFSYTPVGGKPSITATATNLSTGDTSEFSANPLAVQPGFTAGNQTALENSGAHAVAGWATFDPGPGASAAGQTATYTVSGISDRSLFAVGPTVDAGGTLRYTLAPNVFGTSTFTVQARGSGGSTPSVPQTFTLTVTPVATPLVVLPGILVRQTGDWLFVQGNNFTPATAVLGNGKSLKSFFLSSTLLLVRVPASDRGGHVELRVLTPGLTAPDPLRLRIARRVSRRTVAPGRVLQLARTYKARYGREVDALFPQWLQTLGLRLAHNGHRVHV